MRYNRLMKLVLAVLCTLYFGSYSYAQIRVVNYNIANLRGDHEALQQVFDIASEDDSHGKAMQVSIFLFQEVPESKVKPLHALLGPNYSKGTFTDQGESSRAGAQAMFYDATQLIEQVDSHKDIFTGAGRYADRWELRGVGKRKGTVLWVYSTHLKASRGEDNQDQRKTGAVAILEDIATLPEGSFVILAGDMNFYNNQEPAYQAITKLLRDPLGAGAWSDEDGAIKHTQSPRTIREGGLIHGGLDDRFDFQFISESLRDGKGLDIVEGSYHSLGNDGRHYDVAINRGDNTYFANDPIRANTLATALHDASDHLPVMADYDLVSKTPQETVPAPATEQN